MMVEIRIPKIGVSMTEATLAGWLAEDGAEVREGDALYLLEMEKATDEVVAPVSGKLRIIGTVGQIYPVGELIATIG